MRKFRRPMHFLISELTHEGVVFQGNASLFSFLILICNVCQLLQFMDILLLPNKPMLLNSNFIDF